MKLSRLYSNRPDLFEPLSFTAGLNVILGEIRHPENRNKDTHNLGKTTLGRLIDFCLLLGKDNSFFLFKHIDVFEGFIFFLEVRLFDGSFITIRRSVDEATKISFKSHQSGNKDFRELGNWDHSDVPFDKAKELLDGVLDLRAFKPWPFRKGMGYILRSQYDFKDVFQLQKFAAGHKDWKPYLAQILGFNAELITSYYAKEGELKEKETNEIAVQRELGGSVGDLSKIDGLLLLKQKEAERKQRLLDAFDFRSQDKEKTKELVDEIDEQIADLNAKRYSLNQNKKKITESLKEDQILFDPEDAKGLFKEAGILFEGQIKKDFEQLLQFNKAISDERRIYLEEELSEIDNELKSINSDLSNLGKRRSNALSFLSETDVFNKYKNVSTEMVNLRADITSLGRQRAFLNRLQELRGKIRSLKEEKNHLQSKVEYDVETQNSDPDSLFTSIRLFFNEIVEEVIDRKAVLSVSPNDKGHVVFKAEILDERGKTTSAGFGNTYRKLLCIAFDLAVLRAHLKDQFPRFVFHDGIFESLDDRKKENLLLVIRHYAELGIQHFVTLIDTDLPIRPPKADPIFDETEIILRLHDDGPSGRLFKMDSW